MKNYYSILGVPREAEVDLIRATYLALSKIYHPDVFKGDKKFAQKRMQDINEAFETLSDEKKEKNMIKKQKVNLMKVLLMIANFKMNNQAIKILLENLGILQKNIIHILNKTIFLSI